MVPEKVQLKREFAADSLQIAQLPVFGTNFGCSCGEHPRIASGGGAAKRGINLWRELAVVYSQ
jgi:hypothetical protein